MENETSVLPCFLGCTSGNRFRIRNNRFRCIYATKWSSCILMYVSNVYNHVSMLPNDHLVSSCMSAMFTIMFLCYQMIILYPHVCQQCLQSCFYATKWSSCILMYVSNVYNHVSMLPNDHLVSSCMSAMFTIMFLCYQMTILYPHVCQQCLQSCFYATKWSSCILMYVSNVYNHVSMLPNDHLVSSCMSAMFTIMFLCYQMIILYPHVCQQCLQSCFYATKWSSCILMYVSNVYNHVSMLPNDHLVSSCMSAMFTIMFLCCQMIILYPHVCQQCLQSCFYATKWSSCIIMYVSNVYNHVSMLPNDHLVSSCMSAMFTIMFLCYQMIILYHHVCQQCLKSCI